MSDFLADWIPPQDDAANEPQVAGWSTDTLSPRADREPPAPLNLSSLARSLSRLGPVLWLERRSRTPSPTALLRGHAGVRLAHPALTELGRCVTATAHTTVTPQGPREWLSFLDGAGDVRAKMFLLPDTDYLAWDEMTETACLRPHREDAAPWQAHAAFLRSAWARFGHGWAARVLSFQASRMRWLHSLDARPPLRLSLIGIELAGAIARSENAELVSPLHCR